MMVENETNLKNALNKYFGFDSFKGEQEAVIKSLLSGQDTFVIMPTGGGKSLCYQLPALLSEGTAIVISPLIALMKNQVDMIRNYASHDNLAHFLNSSLNKGQIKQVKEDIASGKTKLLYVAPETLTKQENIDFFRDTKVSFVAVDEAHCISEWGHDFRPEYRRIRDIIEAINDKIPIIALTATATPKVQMDIQKTLNLHDPNVFVSSFNRPNLYYELRPKKSEASATRQILQIIGKHRNQSGIIYVTNRKTAEKIAQSLVVNGIKAAPYHAGIENKTRTATQDRFLMEEIDVIVATIAFGMGIDKPDIRFVIHFDISKSLENYYQETGRGGRDGLEGKCYAFFSYRDISKIEKLLKDKTVAEKERANQLIDEIIAYASTGQCRRKFLLHYFGEEFNEEKCNKMCDNCAHPKEKIDVTTDTVTALKTILEVKENHVLQHMVDVMVGKKANDVNRFKHDLLKVFGKGKEQGPIYWSSVFRNAILENLIKKDIEQYGLLKLTQKGNDFIQKPYQIEIPVDHDYDTEAEDIIPIASESAALDPALLNQLKDLRKKVSKQNNLPPYVIFQDISLDEMATRYPITEEEFSSITGVSKGKFERYGREFSKLIEQYVEENDILRPEDIVVKTVVKKSNNKVKIIKAIDSRLTLDEIARSLQISLEDLIDEMEVIVNSGTKLNLDYHLYDALEEEVVDDVFDFFKTVDSDGIKEALEEFEDDDLSVEDVRLIKIKFISELAN